MRQCFKTMATISRAETTAGSALLMVALLLIFNPQASGNQIIIDGTQYGPNETITIWGDIDYITNCPGEGTPDGWPYSVYPVADIYVVVDGSVSGSSTVSLTDASGAANTITAYGAGGSFFDEVVAFTAPSGNLGSGRYDLVIDECQDGEFNPGVDYILGAGTDYAFDVAIVGPIPASAINGAKAAAMAQAVDWAQSALGIELSLVLHDLINDVSGILTNPWKWVLEKLISQINPYSAMLGQARELMFNLHLARIAYWADIAADPPDPNYIELEEMGAYETILPLTDSGADYRFITFVNESSEQAAILPAFLAALEKYQGAQAADDIEWSLIQAQQLNKYGELLSDNLQAVNEKTSALATELSLTGIDFAAVAEQLTAIQNRFETDGLTEEELSHLFDLGYSEAEVNQALQEVLADDFTPLIEKDISEWLGDYQDSTLAAIAGIDGLLAGTTEMIGDLTPLAGAFAPVSDPGGPYTGSEGDVISFDGSASYDPDGDAITYAWDLNGDAVFDDGSEALGTHTYPTERSGLVALQVTDESGLSAVGYAELKVTAANSPPEILSISPEGSNPVIASGASLTFSADASDPDADPLTYTWALDGVVMGSGQSWQFTTNAGETGAFGVLLTISDGNALSPDRYHSWTVLVESAVTDNPPVISCPDDITIDCAGSSDPATTGTATAGDDLDPNPTVTFTDEEFSGACPQEWTIERTWLAVDNGNNSTTCTQTITVTDSTAPTIICPSDIALTYGEPTDTGNTGSATASDNCDTSPQIQYSDEDLSSGIRRTWTATDACGNTASCEQIITVVSSYYLYTDWNPGVNYTTGIDGWVDTHGLIEGIPGSEYLVFTGGPSYAGHHTGYLYRVETDGDPNMHPDNPLAPGPIAARTFTPVSSHYLGNYESGHENAYYMDSTGIYYGADPSWASVNDCAICQWDFEWNLVGCAVPIPPPVSPQTLARNPRTGDWWIGSTVRQLYRWDGSAWVYQFTHPNLGGGHHDGMEIIGNSLFISDMTSDIIIQYRLDDNGDPIDPPADPFKTFTYSAGPPVEGMGFGPNKHIWISGWSSGTIYEIGGGALQPWMEGIPDQTVFSGESFETFDLDDYAGGLQQPVTWSWIGNNHLTVNRDNNNVVQVSYAPGWYGNETITFTVTDAGQTSLSDDATFTVIPVATADAAIEPNPMLRIYSNNMFGLTGRLSVSGLSEGFTLSDIDTSSVMILANDDTIPTAFIEYLPADSAEGIDEAVFGFVAGALAGAYTWEMDTTVQSFGITGEFIGGVVFTGQGEFLMVGHLSGDVDMSGHVNVADLTYLVAYLFQGGPAPAVPEAADIDRNSAVNIRDLTGLVNFLFRGD